jgi:hypothetical protein
MTLPDVSDFATYGAMLQNAQPVVNPLTDIDAAKLNLIQSDTAGMTYTAFRAWAIITLAATSGAMGVVAHGATWGANLAVKPTPARVSTGVFTCTWPTSITDDFANVKNLNFLGGPAPNVMSATLYFARIVAVAANVVTFQVWNAAGALNDAAAINIFLAVR